MATKAIRALLETHLFTLTGGLAANNTQFEGCPFEPVDGVPFQRVQLMPAAPHAFGGLSRHVRHSGYFQVDLHFPYGQGSGAAGEAAEALAAHFRRGLSLTANNVTTRIAKVPEIRPGRLENGRWVVPVIVTYFCNLSI